MQLSIDNRSDQPIYEQIALRIKAQIISGALAEDTLLPSIRSLAKDLRISVITTKRAYEELERAGMTFSGTSPDGSLVEIAELSEQDWYVGCQFHPEFKSRPDRPHPLFTGFVAAALRKAGK